MLVWVASSNDCLTQSSSQLNIMRIDKHWLVYNSYMGQINCQCQYLPQEDMVSLKSTATHHLFPEESKEEVETSSISTKLTLKNKSNFIDIRLREGSSITYGTTDDCQQKALNINSNSFKIQLRLNNHSLFVTDCGVGLGVFLMKKKITQKADGTELLLSVEDSFAMIKIRSNEQITVIIYNNQLQEKKILQRRNQHEISVANDILILRRERDGRDYSIKRASKKGMWILLTQERKVKLHDVLRMGLQLFEVDGLNSYIEPVKLVHKY